MIFLTLTDKLNAGWILVDDGHIVKSHFQKIDIECWYHSGRSRSIGPSICLFRSLPNSCDPLLRAIEELNVAGPPARRMLTFKPCSRPNRCASLRLILSNESDDFHPIRISVEGEIATIEVTLDGLRQLREAIVRWRDGAEDFRLSPPHQRNSQGDPGKQNIAPVELWFWGPHYAGP